MPELALDLSVDRRATAERPLLGQTVLVVEDSRFACEALRLLCLRSGARIRRADSLRAASRHLAVYRPSIAVIDLGLPDGSGLDLVRDLARSSPRIPVLLAISGEESRRAETLSAGADDFLAKPLTSLAVFQSAVLAHLPAERRPGVLREVPTEKVRPDDIALRDDLTQIRALLTGHAGRDELRYAAQFLSGIAVSAEDTRLEEAAGRLSATAAQGGDPARAVAFAAGVISERLSRVRTV